jgi:hypothetical protein
MVRTVISLDEDDKRWLDRKAAEEGVPMTEIVRRAVRRLRGQSPAGHLSMTDLLAATRGLWKRGDGLDVQRGLRDEW